MKRIMKMLLAGILMIPFAEPGRIQAEENDAVTIVFPDCMGRQAEPDGESFALKLTPSEIEGLKNTSLNQIHHLLPIAIHSGLPHDHVEINRDCSIIRVFTANGQYEPDDPRSLYGIAKACAVYQALLQIPVSKIETKLEIVNWRSRDTLAALNLMDYMRDHPEYEGSGL